MATTIEYALMAGASYRDTRPDINKFPIPAGWNMVSRSPQDNATGFEAAAFGSGTTIVGSTNIVISFAGTYDNPLNPITNPDLQADIGLATGLGSDQLLQAVEYYLDVKRQNLNATITLTGHSLGGGLASLVGVFFHVPATTFDQAPFANSAQADSLISNPFDVLTPDVAAELKISLLGAGYTEDELAPLTNFLLIRPADGSIPNSNLVTNIRVDGELLSSVFPINAYDTIGTTVPPLQHGQASVSSTDLHSQALLTAFLQSDATAATGKALDDVTYKLTDLLEMIFDKKLYRFDTDKLNENFIDRLVRHEAGNAPLPGGGTVSADAMVTRFTSDLWKLAQDGGLTLSENFSYANWNNVSKALIAFAMQKYYEENNPNITYGTELFSDLSAAGLGSNGITFDIANVSKDLNTKLQSGGVKYEDLVKDIKGFGQYFQAYIDTTGLLSSEERTLIKSLLPYMRDWYVQAGASGMLATDSMNRGAFMLGGSGNDALVGGTGADLLVGNAGTDLLQGGQGNDTLLGGVGNDAYVYATGDGLDTILDTGGQNTLSMDGNILAGGDQYGDSRVHKDADGHLYVQADSKTLIVDGNIVIQNYGTGGTFGLTMNGATTVANPTTTRDIVGDFGPQDFTDANGNIVYHYDDLSNLVTDPAKGGARADNLNGSSGNDHIMSGAGDDYISATQGGSDFIEAGSGRDQVTAGAGNDVVIGGTEGDILSGGAGDDRLYANTQMDVAIAIAQGNAQTGSGLQGDWLAGGAGSDTLVGSTGNDVLSGGSGSDLLIGGAGDDDILGDTDYVTTSFDWTVTNSNGTRLFSPVVEQAAVGAADVIYAGNGNDYVWAGQGNDVVFGEGGDDRLSGNDGNDIIIGGAATNVGQASDNDILWGGAGSDYLDGGDGADEIVGGTGDDIIIGGKGIDTLHGGEGKDIYIFSRGDGRDTVIDTKADNNIFRFGAGISASDITLRLGSLMLDLGNGDEIHIDGFDQTDVFNSSSIGGFEFEDGTILSTGELLARGFDLDGTVGDDQIIGTNTTDRIQGFDGNDVLFGGLGTDTLSGGAGNDQIAGDNGGMDTSGEADTIDGGDGHDIIDGQGGDDRLLGGAGNDIIGGGQGSDLLDGGAGDDTLYGEAGDDTYVVDSANDIAAENANEGTDTVLSGVSYTLGGNIENLTLTGTAAIDGMGNALDNVIVGNAGNNVLSGFYGNDTYRFNRGDGADTIADNGDFGSIDTLQFGPSTGSGQAQLILQSDVTVRRTPVGDLEFTLNGSTDKITVQGWYGAQADASRIERIVFGDGSTLTPADFENLPITGTEGDDVIDGGSAADTLIGLGGNDVLDGGAGNDTLIGGEGLDTYSFSFGMGRDNIIDASLGGNTIELQAGMSFNDLRATQSGNDLLLTIRGTDQGMTLKDYYTAPQDWTVQDGAGAQQTIADVLNATNQDEYSALRDDLFAAAKVSIAEGYLAQGYQWQADGTLTRSPIGGAVTKQIVQGTSVNTITYRWTNGNPDTTTSSTTVSNNDSYIFPNYVPGLVSGTAAINQTTVSSDAAFIQADAGSNYSYSTQYVKAQVNWGSVFGEQSSTSSWINGLGTLKNVYGNVIATTVSSTSFTDYRATQVGTITALHPSTAVVNGGVGTQLYVNGYTYNLQEIAGGASNNTLDAGTNQYAALNGGAGDDTLYGGALQYGGEGNDTLSGGNFMYGGNGDDTLANGDVMAGGAGNDTMYDENRPQQVPFQGNYAWQLQSSATRYLIDPTQTGIDLIRDAGDSEIAYKDWYYTAQGISNRQESEQHGGQWSLGEGGYFDTYEEALAMIASWGMQPAEMIANGSFYYVSPLPVFNRPAAYDYAALQDAYDAGVIPVDTLEFAAGVSLFDLQLSWGVIAQVSPISGADEPYRTLNLSWNGGASQVQLVIPHADDPLGSGVERIRFADGSFVLMQDLIAMAPPVASLDPRYSDLTLTGTEGADVLTGEWANDTLIGLGGDDQLNGGGGNDTLIGGAGNDTLAGGAGDDTYVFEAGNGVDTIVDTVGANTLVFGAGVDPASVTLSLGSLLIKTGNGNDAIHIQNFDPNDVYAPPVIASFQFADGTTLAYDQLLDRGFDIDGTTGNDILNGTNTNDRISGGAGDDILSGGAGNDVLNGGTGSDTYVVAADGGQSMIVETYDPGSVDRVVFASGIAAADLSAVRGGTDNNDLIVSVSGTSVSLTIQGWFDPASPSSVSQFEFADGVLLDIDTIINHAPVVIGVIADHALQQDQAFNLDVSSMFGDADIVRGDELTYSVTLANGSALPLWLTFDAATQTFGGTPGNEDVGSLNVIVTATDSGGLSASSSFALNVTNTNDAPVAVTALDGQSANEDAASSFTVPANAFSDADFMHGDSLIYSATMADGSALPSWLAFDAATQTFSGIPGNADVGTLNVSVMATDAGGLSATSDFVLNVLNVNDAPMVVAPLADQSVTEGQALGYSIFGSAEASFMTDATDTVDSNSGGINYDAYLWGNIGNDIYSFGRGDGNVLVNDWDSTIGNVDTVQFAPDILPTDISIRQDQWGSIILTINGTGDSLTLGDYLYQDAGRIEQLVFSDGTVWEVNDILSMISTMPTTGNDYLVGTGGNDFIAALAGDDILLGGAGDDELQGGDGNDFLDAGTGNNTLQGGMGNDDLEGNIGTDMLDGGDGDDYLWGGDGDDTLDGGAGNDVLEDGQGNDTYIFGRGYGQDVVYEWDPIAGNIDTVRLAADVSSGDITAYQDPMGGLVLSINGTNDSLRVNGWFSSNAQKVEQFVFADGTVWGASDIISMLSPAPSVTPGDDEIVGTEGNDVIKALAGDDWVSGEVGDDVIVGGAGDDDLRGGMGSDILNGGSGWDTLFADRSYSDLANDLLAGGADGDNLNASISNDLLIGGTGNDDVIGDDGNDVVLFNRGDGNDWYGASFSANGVPLVQRTDTVSLGGGIGYSDLSLERGPWNSLVLNLGNGEAITFDGWFDASLQDNKAISTLQVVVEAMAGYDANSADPLLNKRIQQFDFVGLANQFEAAQAADPTLTIWQLATHLADFSLGGSDTAAIGGDMAYLYGKNGNLDGLTEAELRAQLNDVGFGTANQTLTRIVMGGSGGIFTDEDIIHGDSLTYSATLPDGSPLPAWLSFDAATGTFSGTPASTDAGILEVAVTATDRGGLSATTTFQLNVASLNSAPVAASDSFVIGENGFPVVIAAADLLSNDIDPDVGDTLSLVGFDVATAQGNTVSQDANGNLVVDVGSRYQSLGAGQTAADSFGYIIADAAGLMSSATVNVSIAGSNDAPVSALPIADQSMQQDASFSFTVPSGSFTDIDNGDVLSYSVTLADGSTLPGWLSFDATTQTFSGTPGNWDVGNYNVTVTATDMGGLSACSTFAVDVANVNDAPMVSMALLDQGALQDAAFNFTVPAGTFNDVDFIHGDTLSYSAILADGTALPSWLSFDAATGTFSGTPGNLDVGNLNVLVTATDTGGLSASSAFNLDVVNVNDTPTANADTGAATEDGGAVLLDAATLLSNDTDPDFIHGDVLNIVGVSQADSGASVSLVNGSVQYDAGTLFQSLAQGQTATDTFSYTVSDTAGASSTATVTMTVTGVNDGPVTKDDFAALTQNAQQPASGNVLANDSDVDQGTVLSVANAGVIAGNYGSLTLSADGSYSYVLDNTLVQSLGAGQSVTETFAYQATDGIAITPATLSVTITGANDAPVVASPISGQQTNEDALFSFSIPTGTFTDIDNGDVLTYSATLADGTVLPSWLSFDAATQTFSGTPGNWDVGHYSVTVTATDTGGLSVSSTLAVDVANVNDAPTVSMALVDQATLQDASFSFTVPAGTFDDVDFIHGDTLSYSATLSDGSTLPGWLSFDAATQTFSGTPANGDVGNLSVRVTATDTGGLSASSAFNLDVVNVNDTPTANADTGAAVEDGGAVLLDAANLLANDTDPDFIHGDMLNIVGVSQADSGASVSLVPSTGSGQVRAVQYDAGSLFQSLGQGQTATDTFSYTVSDLAGATSTATVTMTVTGTNDGPVTADDAAAVQEDGALIATGNVLSNDSDVDQGTVLSVANAGVFVGNYGQLTLAADGSYSYALDNGSLGVQSLAEGQVVTEIFTYEATDGLVSTPSTLTVSITGTNDAPVVATDTAAVQEDVSLTATGNVLANDSDVDQGAVLSVANAGVFVGNYGQLTLAADGSYSYASDNGSLGVQSLAEGQVVTETFAYVATDGLISTPSTLAVSITGTNDAPVVVADTAAVQEDITLIATGNALTNDSDVDQGTVLSVANAGVFVGNYGQLTLAVDGNYSYALDNGSLGVQSLAEGQVVTETFAYEATDGLVSTPSTLTVSITGTNDAPVVVADTATVREDITLTATGNVLANDSDIDQGAVLSVADAGVRAGSYGSLTLAVDGSYTYQLDNVSPAVQSLGRDARVAEHFSYTATDGIVGASAVLDIFLDGSNDAPILVAPLEDRSFKRDKDFSWQVPDGSFIDIDQGDKLDYAATLADGSALPEWLSFDAATLTFSGETPKEKGFVDVRLTATDSVAASGNSVGSLSVSDVFRISIGHGDKDDSPDCNFNDGRGNSSGHHGAQGGHGSQADHSSNSHGRESDNRASDSGKRKGDDRTQEHDGSGSSRTEELIRAWFEEESASEQYSSFSAQSRKGGRGSQTEWQVNRNVARGVAGDIGSEWERMNARLKQHLEQAGNDDGISAEFGRGAKPSDLFGMQNYSGMTQLGMGNSQQMKGFTGLKEGLERLGC